MMKYFSIQNSLDEKIMGTLPQVKEVKHNCNVLIDPHFIDKFPFEKIEIEPILSNPILHPKAKKTDLIDTGGMGFSFGSLFMSNRLKEIIENSNHFGIQFFKTSLYQKNVQDITYWQTHIYDIPYDYYDFAKTKIILKDRDENRKVIKKELEINSKDDFLNITRFLKYPKMVNLKNIEFKPEMNLDYFFPRYLEDNNLGVVSEKLKNRIEEKGCTGIEFKPMDISLNEWLGKDGLREKIYGLVPQMRPDGSIRK